MKYQIELNTKSAREDIFDLKKYLEEEGINANLIYEKEDGMLGGDYLNILEIVCSSTVAVAIINGVFNSIKNYVQIKSQNKKYDIERDTIKVSKKDNETSIEVVIHKDNIDDLNKLVSKLSVDSNSSTKNK